MMLASLFKVTGVVPEKLPKGLTASIPLRGADIFASDQQSFAVECAICNCQCPTYCPSDCKCDDSDR